MYRYQYLGIDEDQAMYGDPDKWGYEPADPFAAVTCGPGCESWCDGIKTCEQVKAHG
jgi:hypothetical protein